MKKIYTVLFHFICIIGLTMDLPGSENKWDDWQLFNQTRPNADCQPTPNLSTNSNLRSICVPNVFKVGSHLLLFV